MLESIHIGIPYLEEEIEKTRQTMETTHQAIKTRLLPKKIFGEGTSADLLNEDA